MTIFILDEPHAWPPFGRATLDGAWANLYSLREMRIRGATSQVMGDLERAVLLAMVHLRGEGYAVSIADEIERRSRKAPSLGAIYGTLDRLQNKGFVSSRFGEPTPERGGKRKRLYKAEAAGVRVLREQRALDNRMWAGAPLGARV
jgi:PadR family transcriptional regulator, regulatory protein PadR